MAAGDSDDYGFLAAAEREPPSVWMRVLRYHTYHGRRQEEGDIYLCYPEEVENIENLRFALRDTPPPRAKR